MMTMRESVERHVAAGVEGLDELSALVAVDIGRVPRRTVLQVTKYNVKHPEKTKQAHRKKNARWYQENPAKKLLRRCQQLAQKRGRECSITINEIEALLVPMVCSVTGIPLSLTHDGESARNPWGPSIDRIDCSIGYVSSNVRVVCALYNLARADWPDEVVMTMARALVAKAP